MSRELLQQALGALENDAMQRTFAGGVRISNAVLALRAALAAPQGEPVAWRYQDARGHYRYRKYVAGFDVEYSILKPVPLYAAPPAAPQGEADPEIKAAYITAHGTDRGWLGVEGSYFISGYTRGRKYSQPAAPSVLVADAAGAEREEAMIELASASRELGRLRAERDALRADAARYRLLAARMIHVAHPNWPGWTLDEVLFSGDRDLDETVDALTKEVK